METEIWTRNAFNVEAVQLTEENLREFAEWTKGEICRTLSHDSKVYVLVDTVQYNRYKQTKVFIGDWVILVQGQFKHYRNNSLRLAYHRRPKTKVEPQIRELVQQALLVDPSTSYMTYEDMVNTFTAKLVSIAEGRDPE